MEGRVAGRFQNNSPGSQHGSEPNSTLECFPVCGPPHPPHNFGRDLHGNNFQDGNMVRACTQQMYLSEGPPQSGSSQNCVSGFALLHASPMIQPNWIAQTLLLASNFRRGLGVRIRNLCARMPRKRAEYCFESTV